MAIWVQALNEIYFMPSFLGVPLSSMYILGDDIFVAIVRDDMYLPSPFQPNECTLHNHWKKCFALEYFFSLVFHHKGITFYMPWKKRQKNIWHEPNIQWIIEIGLIYNRHLPYMESMQQIIPLSKQFGLIEAISGALTNIFSVILLDRMRQIQ